MVPLHSGQPSFPAHLSEENGGRSNEVRLYNKQRKLQQLRPFKWDSTVQHNNEKYNSDRSNEILLYYKTAKTTAMVTVQIRFHCTAKLCTTRRSTSTNLVAKINHNLQTFFYFSLKVDFLPLKTNIIVVVAKRKDRWGDMGAAHSLTTCKQTCSSHTTQSTLPLSVVRIHWGCTQPHNL